MNKQTKLLLSLAGVLLLCSVIFNIVSASKVAKMAVLQQTIEVITDSCKVLNEANDSQVDTIQSLQSKIEDLQVAIGASGNKLKQKINDLANEKESLNTEINELRREIETLRYEINTLKKKSATPAAKTPAPNVKKDDKPTKTATAKQYIEQAVNSLEGLRNIKNKDEKKAPIEVEKYRKDAIRALKSFNEKTKKYERDVNEMIKCLETSNLFNPSKNVIGAPDKSFVVKKDTQDKVKEFVNKLNDIKKKL